MQRHCLRYAAFQSLAPLTSSLPMCQSQEIPRQLLSALLLCPLAARSRMSPDFTSGATPSPPNHVLLLLRKDCLMRGDSQFSLRSAVARRAFALAYQLQCSAMCSIPRLRPPSSPREQQSRLQGWAAPQNVRVAPTTQKNLASYFLHKKQQAGVLSDRLLVDCTLTDSTT